MPNFVHSPLLFPRRSILGIRFAFLVALGFILPIGAQATDGVIEINHTCAVQTGCFSGDTPGYPVTIDGQAGRSYRLTSDLIVPANAFVDGIKISTSDLGIDLNNFAIIRTGCDVDSTSGCTPSLGSGSGVDRTSTLNRGISVRNGSIVGMGGYGVLLGEQAQVRNLRVRWNRLGGIRTSIAATITGNTASENGGHGIEAFNGATISGNTAHENGGDGIHAEKGSSVSGNTAHNNGDDGIDATASARISGNTAHDNGSDGIVATEGAVVSGNTVYRNALNGILVGDGARVSGNSAFENTRTGIDTRDGSRVSDNAVTGNELHGIRVGAGSLADGNTVRENLNYGIILSSAGYASAYRANVMTGNGNDAVFENGTVVNLGDNVCNSNTSCP